MASASQQELKREASRLYEQYGRPLEAEHRGEYDAIAPSGRNLLAPTLVEALGKAIVEFGYGNFVFKVGQRTVGIRR